MLVRTAHRVAAAMSVIFGALAVVAGGRYLAQHGGWDIASGSSELMTLMLLVLAFVCSLSFALLRPGARNVQGARLTSIVWSLALLAALLFTWRVVVVSDRWVYEIGARITAPQDLDAFIAAHPEPFAPYDYRVPTGVLLQSFEFLDSHNVELSGYVWQRYGPEIPEHVVRGVVFPEALEEAHDAQEAWRVERDGTEYIGWYFSGQFRQNFDYALYPFDRQGIWLRLWHPDMVENVLLVPDFAGFHDLTPQTLPGIDTQFVYGGWDPVLSEFTYALHNYNVDFGLGNGITGDPEPELYFNLSLERDFLGPMLEHGVLEAAIAILLFLLLMMLSPGTVLHERVGLTSFDLIVAAGGLLFAVILDHNAIRSGIQSQSPTYLEWFPLLLSCFIVLVVLSAVLRDRQWRIPLLGYSGDLVPVLAYWPALLGALLAVTLVIFFY